MIAQRDPNPLVNGKALQTLRRAGISVTVGVGKSEAIELNRAYNHYMRARRPYVILKAGMTLDGQIATASGEAKWITEPAVATRRPPPSLGSRCGVGRNRDCCERRSIVDRPSRPRFKKLASKQPLRVVADSRLRIPFKSHILNQQHAAKTLIATTRRAPAARRHALTKLGVEVVVLPSLRGRVSLPALMRELGSRGVTSLLVEGGSEINAAMLRAELVHHLRLYIAPALLGGSNAKG